MVQVQNVIQAIINDIVAVAPRVVGAVILLLLGWIVGRIVGWAVTGFVRRTGLSRWTRDTPISSMFDQDVSKLFGLVARLFVYAIAILAAADVLAIPQLSAWLALAVSYLPAFFGGLLVILLGIIVADLIGDMIERMRAPTKTAYVSYFADGVRIFLYFTVIVVGLDTMGVNVALLYIIAGAVASGLVLAVAIGAGIAFGLGGKEYVAENIEDWMRHGREQVEE